MLPQGRCNKYKTLIPCYHRKPEFLLVTCHQCSCNHPATFSCKYVGILPSCTAHRRVEIGTKFVDEVFPAVPIRQWLAYTHLITRTIDFHYPILSG